MTATTSPVGGPVLGLGVEHRPPSRLRLAFWLAALTEAALIMGGTEMAWHRPAVRALAPPVEQIRLVQLPKPVATPKPRIETHPLPTPVRKAFNPRPRLIAPPPIALPPPPALPPSTVAEATPSPPPPEPAVAAISTAEKATYLEAVKSAIQAAVQFPADARVLRRDGKVKVAFQLVDGMVKDVRVLIGGGLRSFDINAASAVREASMPAPPKALAHQAFTLVLWVRFNLHRSS